MTRCSGIVKTGLVFPEDLNTGPCLNFQGQSVYCWSGYAGLGNGIFMLFSLTKQSVSGEYNLTDSTICHL